LDKRQKKEGEKSGKGQIHYWVTSEETLSGQATFKREKGKRKGEGKEKKKRGTERRVRGEVGKVFVLRKI